jgi:WD40 repeat protein
MVDDLSTTTSPTDYTSSADSDSNADASQPAFSPSDIQFKLDHSDWSLEYNPEIRQTFSLHLANTFEFRDTVLCTKFSRDGEYLAIGLWNGETHVYDLKNGSNRLISECCLGNLSSQLIILSVLVKGSITVFYNEAVTVTPQQSVITAVQFNLDNKYIATGASWEDQGHINVVKGFFFILDCTHFIETF